MDFVGSEGYDMLGGATYSADGGATTINMDKLRRIQASIPVQDPNAPLGSNKNPIRIIQQGNRFITTQNLTDEQLSQITQVLHNQSILSEVQKSPPAPPIIGSAVSSMVTPSARGLTPTSKSLFRDLDNTSQPSTAKRRRGKRSPEEEDPDFDPIAEEEGRKPGRYLYPDDSIVFQCDRCDLQFQSRQALLKHVQLRHEQREARRTVYIPVKKRSALKAAVKTSTDEELVDICLPRLAKLANPFDFLLVKSERGDPPLPNLAMLVDDLVNLVDISRKFLRDHLVRLPPTGDQRPLGSVSIDSQAKADILGVEVGNYGVRALFNEGYLPPRHRVSLQQSRRLGANLPQQQQQQEFVTVAATGARFVAIAHDADVAGASGTAVAGTTVTSTSGVLTESAAGSFEISMKIGPKTAQTVGRQQQQQRTQQQPAITDKDIAVERYYQVLDENGQPSEFVIEVATGQFFNRITGEQVAVMQESADGDSIGEVQQQQQPAVQQLEQQQHHQVVAASDKGAAEVVPVDGSHRDAAGAAVIGAGDAVVGKSGVAEPDVPAAVSSAEVAEAPEQVAATDQVEKSASSTAAPAASVAADEATTAGDGQSAEVGEPVQIDLSTMFPGVTLQDLDDNVLLITKPDGSTLQVEHGGQGITLEFLQELLNTQFD